MITLQGRGTPASQNLLQRQSWWCHKHTGRIWKGLLLTYEVSWGTQGRLPVRSKNGLKNQGKGFIFIVIREWGWNEDSCVWEPGLAYFELACLNLATKVGAPRIFYQLAQMWGRRGKWNCGVWKMLAVKMKHQNVRLLITV